MFWRNDSETRAIIKNGRETRTRPNNNKTTNVKKTKEKEDTQNQQVQAKQIKEVISLNRKVKEITDDETDNEKSIPQHTNGKKVLELTKQQTKDLWCEQTGKN